MIVPRPCECTIRSFTVQADRYEGDEDRGEVRPSLVGHSLGNDSVSAHLSNSAQPGWESGQSEAHLSARLNR
jgi:hypothetical protein